MNTKLQAIKARLGISSKRKNQGVAILTVLAIITLMTVLVVSFFNMAQTAKVTAKGSVEIQRVTTLKDTIINLVIAQFREASKLAPVNPGDPREIVTWISQPGAIRTFAANPTDFSRNRLYKLYSSSVPQIGLIAPFDSASLMREINKDLMPDWDTRPDEYTDLNRPVYTAATGDKARTTGSLDAPGFSYPIVDPRAYNGGDGVSDIEKNVEGFSYSPRSDTPGGVTLKGVDARQGQLAMPVRWIYILEDGTLGYLDNNGEFTTLNGTEGGDATRENPIVGRLAWWADDESCKINVNTASIPSAWDTPRTTSLEDQWLAQYQPISGEWQRCPGHPATVDLSAVFYPNRRWVPTSLSGLLSAAQNPAGGRMTLLPHKDALRVWDLAPFIVGEQREVTTGSAGTAGGMIPTPLDATVGQSDNDRLFTSLDEMYFKATGTANVSLNAPRNNLLSEDKDTKLEFLRSLERAQFFLTHKSHSPELTNQGYPRVSMFPMDLLAVPAVGSTGSLPQGVSPYDVTMALNSTIGGKGSSAVGGNAYFFQRRDPTSRHNELYTTGDSRQRNSRVFRYLRELSRLPIPGYPESAAFKVPGIGSEDPSGLSLASKYPPGVNSAGTALFSSAHASTSAFDSSDRTQILLNMLDYTRTINMQAAFLTAGDRYDDGFGQAAAVCGCVTAAGGDVGTSHAAALAYTNQNSRSPKGAGKVFGPAEIGVMFNIAAWKDGGEANGATSARWATVLANTTNKSRTRANDPNKPGRRLMIEMAFVMSGFNPKMGWSPTFNQGGIFVSSIQSNGGNPNSTGALPFKLATDDEDLEVLSMGANTSRTLARSTGNHGILPYGGMGGPRTQFDVSNTGSNIAVTRPFCVIDTTGSGPFDISGKIFPVTTGSGIAGPIRIMPTDGGNSSSNIISAVDLHFPSDFFNKFQPMSGTMLPLADLVPQWYSGQRPFPDPQIAMKSMVLPHGDYRLTATPSRVDPDIFVPVEGYGSVNQPTAFFELNSSPNLWNLKNPSTGVSTSRWNPFVGYMAKRDIVKNYVLSNGNDALAASVTQLPLPSPNLASVGQGVTYAGSKFTPPDQDVVKTASSQEKSDVVAGNPRRNLIFSHGRRDGFNRNPRRGSSDPFETGDFDTGPAGFPDGPYMNHPDEGDRRANPMDAYFKRQRFLAPKPTTGGTLSAQSISPNFLVRSPVDFGSIPSGVANRVPWQTLRFRPDPMMNNPAKRMTKMSDNPPAGLPFANFCGPKDHFFLDMFWMPVVEPWSISEPFSTKGTINMNQQILPFMNIERTTALHALMRGERMYAIPNDAANRYKRLNPSTGEPAGNQDVTYRHFINAKETIRQMNRLYNTGFDAEQDPPGGNRMAFNVYRSASEICELWLVPEGISPLDKSRTLESVIGTVDRDGQAEGFWAEHKLTGDNLRERPYANMYSRVTVRSNVFKLHMVAQTLQKANSQDPKRFDSTKDSVTAEWRGSCMIERSIDPRDPTLTNVDYTNLNSTRIDTRATPRLDGYYTYRVTEVKQLTQ